MSEAIRVKSKLQLRPKDVGDARMLEYFLRKAQAVSRTSSRERSCSQQGHI
jgi:hypothetical protein